MNRSAAMTLVEILIVVVVLGIAAVIAMPMLGETDASRLAAAGRLLIADLQFAQIESISHANDLRGLKFDTAANSYTVVESNGTPFDCSSATAVTNLIGNEPYVTQYGTGRASELDGVTIDSHSLDGDDCLVFGAYGQTDQSIAATVTLQSGSKTLTISIDPISGEATAGP